MMTKRIPGMTYIFVGHNMFQGVVTDEADADKGILELDKKVMYVPLPQSFICY